MGYSDKNVQEISEKSVLNFHLSHVTSKILITLLMKRLQNLFGSIFHQIIF